MGLYSDANNQPIKSTRYSPLEGLSLAWRARVYTTITLLLLAFVGLIVNDFLPHANWYYWRFISPFFAVISMWLNWYLDARISFKRREPMWKEVLHWLAFLLSIYMVSVFVDTGVVGRVEAGLVALTLISLTTFLAGIYFDPTFIIIGVVVGIFNLAAGLVHIYLSLVMIPVVVIAAVIVIVASIRAKNKAAEQLHRTGKISP